MEGALVAVNAMQRCRCCCDNVVGQLNRRTVLQRRTNRRRRLQRLPQESPVFGWRELLRLSSVVLDFCVIF